MNRATSRLCGVLSLALVLGVGVRARAYVRTTTSASNTPVQWNVRCLILTPDKRGSRDVPLDEVTATLQRSIDNWRKHTDACGGMTLTVAPPHDVLDVAPDGLRAVVFRNDEWRRPGDKMPHDPSAIGLTTVMYVDTPGVLGDGTIIDADIELNDVNYTFTTDPANAQARPDTTLADLENTLTHELGHVQGLAHTCWVPPADKPDATPPVDNTGQPVPDCFPPDSLPARITGATMYPYTVTPGETSKRNLSDDDVHGVCDVYGKLTLPCYQQLEGGCAAVGSPLGSRPLTGVTAPARPRGLWLLALLAALGGLAGRRRRAGA